MNKKTEEITISSEFITLGQFLKFADIIQSGGEAKQFLSQNDVYINDELDVRRGRKLRSGDRLTILGKSYIIKWLSQSLFLGISEITKDWRLGLIQS